MRRFASSHLLFTLPALFISLLLSCCTAEVSSETKTYTVTFNTDGGSAIKPIENVAHGSTITKPTDPTKKGYTFVSWHTYNTTLFDFANTKITGDITLYAKWNRKTHYTVTFNTGETGLTVSAQTVKHGDTVVAPFNSPADFASYVLSGWYTDAGKTISFDLTTPITQDMTLFGDFIEAFTVSGSSITGLTDAAKAVPNLDLYIPSSIKGVNITTIGDRAFASHRLLKTVTIAQGITNIEEGAFLFCYGLTGITLPAGLQQIGSSAFANCPALTGITLPAGLQQIGSKAFLGCTGLTGITIPAEVTNIGESAFKFCRSLLTVTFLRDTPCTIGTDVFTYVPVTIIVPKGKKEEYLKGANWLTWRSFISESQ